MDRESSTSEGSAQTKTPISEAEILAARTPRGAWTAKQLAQWGVPWPPPGGWKTQIIAYGYPYDPDLKAAPAPAGEVQRPTQTMLDRMMESAEPELIDGEPFGVEGQLEVNPAKLLHKVVMAVINAGHAADLYDFPEVLAYFGARLPATGEPCA